MQDHERLIISGWCLDGETGILHRCPIVLAQPIVERIQPGIDALTIQELGVLANFHQAPVF
jgi:hypothetical protein